LEIPNPWRREIQDRPVSGKPKTDFGHRRP
jgi:hypothetical protein